MHIILSLRTSPPPKTNQTNQERRPTSPTSPTANSGTPVQPQWQENRTNHQHQHQHHRREEKRRPGTVLEGEWPERGGCRGLPYLEGKLPEQDQTLERKSKKAKSKKGCPLLPIIILGPKCNHLMQPLSPNGFPLPSFPSPPGPPQAPPGCPANSQSNSVFFPPSHPLSIGYPIPTPLPSLITFRYGRLPFSSDPWQTL